MAMRIAIDRVARFVGSEANIFYVLFWTFRLRYMIFFWAGAVCLRKKEGVLSVIRGGEMMC